MRFSYSAIWEDTVRLLRSHGSLAATLAGVFLFLPALLISHFLPYPQTTDPAVFWSLMAEYLRSNVHWLLLSGIVGMIGTLAILMLVFRSPGIAVGAAIAAAAVLLPFYFIANLVVSLALALGFLLFVLPALYLFGRFLPLAPVMVAEGVKSPIAALQRSWSLTRRRGWAVLGMFVLVFVAAFVLTTVIGGIVGAILTLALPEGLGGFLNLIVSSLLSAALQVLLIFLYAAIYRALASGTEAADAAGRAAPRGPARIVRNEREDDGAA